MNKTSIERIGLTKEELENVASTEEDRKKMYSITPIEGRYEKYISAFHHLTSDFEWNRRRVWIEIEYLIALAEFIAGSKTNKKKILEREFTADEKQVLRGLYENFAEKDFLQMKLIEKKTNHDLVACVRWIDYRLTEKGINVEEAIHFGRTSADIDTNVYNSIVRDLVEKEYLPVITGIQNKLIENAKNWDLVFAGQTHGQWAEYTTLKKIFANFIDGIRQGLEGFEQKIYTIGKLGGAIGNNSDIVGAYPELDWENFNKSFIDSLGLEYFPMADQDSFNIRNNEIFDNITRINDVLIKLCEDFWEYCSRGVLVKIPKATESGSSVMAQKANPWRIEGGWEYLSDVDFYKYHNLTKYKRQGDLRRSIRARTIGEPFAKCVIGCKRILEELNLYMPDKELIETENKENIAMSSAYIQTVLRREGKNDAYDQLKKVSMGRKVDVKEYNQILDNLVKDNSISAEVASEIKEGLLPLNNIGNANMLADQAIAIAEKQLKVLEKLYK
jgi:adenylosuccinate lyase